MRFANQVKEAYINHPVIQDLLETAAMAGGSAAYQGIFTDMTPEEIAQSTLIGAGLGLGARPLGAMAGRAGGKALDNAMPGLFDEISHFSPVTRDGSAAALKMLRKGNGSNNPEARVMRDFLQAKRNMAGADQGAGNAEAILSFALRNRADNIAQGGYAFISPFFSEGEQDA